MVVLTLGYTSTHLKKKIVLVYDFFFKENCPK